MASNDDSRRVPRRDVLGAAVGGSAAAFTLAVVYPVARFVEPPSQPSGEPVVVGRLEEFPIDSAKMVLVDDRPVLVLRSSNGELRAFSALCTHLQCVVSYSAERRQIECPCHRGVYSLDGVNIEGPPPRPLDELSVAVSEGSVIVSGAR
ncbi:MAG: ubiquinol-cytochrome c reductase iron-sulfur subunit [Polyangiaceae bacterium]|jgi:cytochrome b6-f complex iron-sulfur subunit